MTILHDPIFIGMLNQGKGIYRRVAPLWLRRRISRAKRCLRTVRYRLYAYAHSKQAVWFCPCCQTRLCGFRAGNYARQPDRFNPMRYQDTLQEVLCPVCGALPRHRILAQWCETHRESLQGRGLYFAPEEGMSRWLRRNGIRFTSADLFQTADLKLDIEDTGQPDGAWDWIVCNHVLEHVNDFRRALKEINRILSHNGILICSFPIDERLESVDEEQLVEAVDEESLAQMRIRRFGQFDHLRVFGRDSEILLSEAGFAVERIDGRQMPEAILPVIGPADYDVNYLFVCRKQVTL